MCQFGDESKIIEELDIPATNPLVGYRKWLITNSFNSEEKHIKSLKNEYLWPKNKLAIGSPLRNNSEGIYNYYNNDYYYNYYYYNNNYCYYIYGVCYLHGKTYKYINGYRSQFGYPKALVTLRSEDNKTKQFVEHFNSIVKNIAKEYNCETVNYSELK